LSYNDCPFIRELYKDFIIEEVTTTYSIAGKPTRGNELLIRNYELEPKEEQPSLLRLEA
jgi:DNA adenine methylase